MQISNSKNTNTGNIYSKGGDVHLGDNYYQSIEFKDLEKTIFRLEKLIQLTEDQNEKAEYYQELKDEKGKLEEFKRGVISLAETFQKIEIDSDRLKSAMGFFNEGKFKEARTILDTEKIESDQQNLLQQKVELDKRSDQNNLDLKNNSDEYLVLAKLTAINFSKENRYQKTMVYFESSLKSNRNDENVFSYAYFLQQHQQINKAILLYQEALEIRKKLAAANPQKYLSDVGHTLNNLGILQKNKNEFRNAEQSYQDALKIQRQLAAGNPQKYLSDVGDTLNNLGVLLLDKKEFVRAETSFQEALGIRKKIAEDNPQTYLSYVASTLNNLGNSQQVKNEFEKAALSYQDALDIYRKLTLRKQQNYLPDLASTLNNLGNSNRVKKEFEKAEASLIEALQIRRKLALINPKAFLPYVATSLNNLGILHSDKSEFEKAVQSYQEALAIRRKLAEDNLQTYLPFVASTLHNLGNAHRERKEFEKAVQSYQEAKEIRIGLAFQTPKAYEIPLADSYLSLCSLYRYDILNKKRSIEYSKKAIELYRKYADSVPHAKKWAEVAKRNLDYWKKIND